MWKIMAVLTQFLLALSVLGFQHQWISLISQQETLQLLTVSNYDNIYRYIYLLWIRIDLQLHTFSPILNSKVYPIFYHLYLTAWATWDVLPLHTGLGCWQLWVAFTNHIHEGRYIWIQWCCNDVHERLLCSQHQTYFLYIPAWVADGSGLCLLIIFMTDCNVCNTKAKPN